MTFRSIALAAAAVALALGARVADAQQDQLDRVGGDSLRGVVSEAGPGAVIITVNGAPSDPIPATEIERLILADEPGELRRGRDSANGQRFEEALAELQKIPAGGDYPAIVKQDIEFYTAFAKAKLALAGTGSANEAATALAAFTKNAPNNWHYFEARKALGDIAALLGRYDVAATSYAELMKAPSNSTKIEGKLLQSDALLRQGNAAGALEGYNLVAGANANGDSRIESLKMLAQIGAAVATAETGKPDDAITALNQIVANTDPTRQADLYPRLYNGLGAAYQKANKPQDALLAYLHVHLLFMKDPDSHAEALYHLSKLWSSVNQSQRALDAKQTLKDRYATSTWASKP